MQTQRDLHKAHVKLSVGASGWTEILSIVASSLAHYNRIGDNQRMVLASRRGRVGTAVLRSRGVGTGGASTNTLGGP